MGRRMIARGKPLRFGQAQGLCDLRNHMIGLAPAQADEYVPLRSLTYELRDFCVDFFS